MVTEERAWWDEIAHTSKRDANIYDASLGTTDECLAEIIPSLGPLSEDAVVLDLGCGVGRLILPMARALGCQFVGLDISTAMVSIARERRAEQMLENVSLIVGDGRSLPEYLEVDAVYSMLMFQHIAADACAGYVREVARILKPGGRFRFQDALGTEDGFLSHQTSVAEMHGWCESAELTVIESEASRLYARWHWLTARKGD